MEEENVKRLKQDSGDRISELPEGIIENILSRLDHPKTRVRVSVLSKPWFALTDSLPFLEFDSNHFGKDDSNRVCRFDRDNFYKYLENTVSRFCRQQQNVMNAHTLKLLCRESVTNAELKIINKCLELILIKGVKVLEIVIMKYGYRLPDILTSASSLTSLKVSDCMLPSSLMFTVANFKSLKVLHLKCVPLDPVVIKHLTASCPLLEELNLDLCSGFKTLNGQFQYLKNFRFLGNGQDEVKKIQIKAPKLCECHISQLKQPEVNLVSCKQLKSLLLDGSFFTPSFRLSDFLSNFPVLENFYLNLVDRCHKLVVSSPSLRKFVLYAECDLEEIDINAPNLLFFCHGNESSYTIPYEKIKINSGELNARMECHIINDVETLFFSKLRRFMEREKRFKVLLLDNYSRAKLPVNFNHLKPTRLPPYELEHVELKLLIERGFLVFLDALLCCFRPRSLSLTSDFALMSDEKRSHILKFISIKLLQQDQGIYNIRIEWSSPSIILAPGYDKTQTITFKKE